MAKLTEKQRRWVEAYQGAAAGNATEAARLAGYKGNDKTLGQVGAENLKKPVILEALEERAKNDPLVADRERLQQFWTSVMLGHQDPGAELKDRLKASELLAKSQGLFVHRVEHSGKDGKPIEHQHNQGPDLSKLSTEQLRAYREHLAAAAGVLRGENEEESDGRV